MIDRIAEQVRRIRLSQRQKDAKVVFQALNDQGKIAQEQHGASQAVVNLEVKSQKDAKKFDPQKIQSTGELLVSGLNNPEVTLAPDTEALAASVVPVLQEELTRQIPDRDEIRIDAKTTVIQPDPKARQMAVSRRGFFGITVKGAIATSIPVSTTVALEYKSIEQIIIGYDNYNKFSQEIAGTAEKFKAAYPAKPTQFKSTDEIKESIEYEKERNETWGKIYNQVSQRYPNRDGALGIVSSLLVTPLISIVIGLITISLFYPDDNPWD